MAIGPYRDKKDLAESGLFLVAVFCVQIGLFLLLSKTGYLVSIPNKIAFVLMTAIISIIVFFTFAIWQERRVSKRIGGK
jgi:hypothetical protein